MKAILLMILVSVTTSAAFATTNALIDRLSEKTMVRLEAEAQQKVRAFARDPNLNLYGFHIDWNNDLYKIKCTYLSEMNRSGNYASDADPFAGTCLIPYTSLHASGFLAVVMTTNHKEQNASIIVMNAVYE